MSRNDKQRSHPGRRATSPIGVQPKQSPVAGSPFDVTRHNKEILARIARVAKIIANGEKVKVSYEEIYGFATRYIFNDFDPRIPFNISVADVCSGILQLMGELDLDKRKSLQHALVTFVREPFARDHLNIERVRTFLTALAEMGVADAADYLQLFPVTKPVDVTTATAWDRSKSDKTAIQYFEEHFGHLPIDQRPFADEISAANRKFYGALAAHQSRAGKSIGDLFPIRPEARGGALAKRGSGKAFSPEEAVAELERRREYTRRQVAAHRARKRNPTPEPK